MASPDSGNFPLDNPATLSPTAAPTGSPTTQAMADSDDLVVGIISAGGLLFVMFVVYNFIQIRRARFAKQKGYKRLTAMAEDSDVDVDEWIESCAAEVDLQRGMDVELELAARSPPRSKSCDDEVFDDPTTPDKLQLYSTVGDMTPRVRVLQSGS